MCLVYDCSNKSNKIYWKFIKKNDKKKWKKKKNFQKNILRLWKIGFWGKKVEKRISKKIFNVVKNSFLEKKLKKKKVKFFCGKKFGENKLEKKNLEKKFFFGNIFFLGFTKEGVNDSVNSGIMIKFFLILILVTFGH